MAPQKLQNIVTNECPIVDKNLNVNNLNKTISKELEFDWSPALQGYILSASAMGLLIFQIPSGMLVTRMSPKRLMLAAVGINSLLTLLIPLCVHGKYGSIILITFRIINGAAEASILPGNSEMLMAWFPSTERTRCISMVSSGIQVSYSCFAFKYKTKRLFTSCDSSWAVLQEEHFLDTF